MRVLVVNAGSSTLKLQVVDSAREAGARGSPSRSREWDGSDPTPMFEEVLDEAVRVDAVGHRVVHGGRHLVEPVVIDDDVVARIGALTSLAPLHQTRALTAMASARAAIPAVSHVACFDTAFHSTMPVAARTYALPQEWRDRWGLERFGFHGLSHAWASRRAPAVAGREPAGLRIVSCHLGAGASACAVVDGRSVDTTMGFTPLDGLVMATRSGSVDPGLLLWLLAHADLSVAELRDGVERRGGLAGLSGTDGDMRAVLERRAAGGTAALAFDVYVHRLRKAIAAMAASAGGLDVLAFTGGVGEHAAPVRAAVVESLAFLGVRVDTEANDAAQGDADLTAAGAATATVVVSSREDLEIARQVEALLG